MKILISNSCGQPIYEQIYTQIKNAIITEELKSGECLPSMRYLAKELRISLITTKRAYDDLEKDGFITSITGKGSYVLEKNVNLMKEEHLKNIEQSISQAVQSAKICGLTLGEVLDMVELIYNN